MNFSLDNNQSQVLDFFHMKLTYLNVQLQACALKFDKNSVNILLMFLLAFAKDQDIIYVCSDKNIKAVSQNVIDVALKGT